MHPLIIVSAVAEQAFVEDDFFAGVGGGFRPDRPETAAHHDAVPALDIGVIAEDDAFVQVG